MHYTELSLTQFDKGPQARQVAVQGGPGSASMQLHAAPTLREKTCVCVSLHVCVCVISASHAALSYQEPHCHELHNSKAQPRPTGRRLAFQPIG